MDCSVAMNRRCPDRGPYPWFIRSKLPSSRLPIKCHLYRIENEHPYLLTIFQLFEFCSREQ